MATPRKSVSTITSSHPKHYAVIDEAHQQLLHEFRHAIARTEVIMDLPTQSQGPLDALRDALISGDFSDLTIVCGARRWQAHRVVVFPQSPVIAATIAEGQISDTLDLSAEDSESVAKLLEYFYTSTYSMPSTGPALSLPTHLRIHALATKFSIDALADLACSRFTQDLENLSDLEVYFTAVIDVYAQTPTGNDDLRHVVAGAAVVEMAQMMAEPLVRKRLIEIMAQVPDFCGDVLMGLTEAKRGGISGADENSGVLCVECGPSEEGYKVDIPCDRCGKMYLHEFN